MGIRDGNWDVGGCFWVILVFLVFFKVKVFFGGWVFLGLGDVRVFYRELFVFDRNLVYLGSFLENYCIYLR